MSTKQSACPSLETLDRFASGKSDETVAEHVLACTECAEMVSDLQSNHTLLLELKEARERIENSNNDLANIDTLISGYDLLEEIGRGGQGTVYRARQLSTDRMVAVKVLQGGVFSTEEQRARFDREVKLVASLDHPNIVTIFDSGLTTTGRAYYVMQFVEGLTLNRWFSHVSPTRSVASLNRAIVLLKQICESVSHAHQNGIIHRDLKPANVLVSDDDTPHLLDFGTAKLFEDERDMTVEGSFVGTLMYSAPEQVDRQQRADVRTDIYALGILAYELLTGQSPFSRELSLAGLVDAIRFRDLLPMTTSLSSILPRSRCDELQAIVSKAVAKDKAHRYQSAAALSDDLDRFLHGRPISARRDHGWYLLRKWMQRHRFETAAALLFLLTIITFGAAMYVLYDRAQTEARRLQQINVFLEDTLGSVESRDGRQVPSVKELIDEAVHWIDIALSDDPATAASIRLTAGNSYRNLGALEDAERQLALARELTRDVRGENHLDYARVLNATALLRHAQQRFDEARDLYNQALAVRQRLGSDNADVAYSLMNLARLERDLDKPKQALQLLDQALAIQQSLHGNQHPDVAMVLHQMGVIHQHMSDFPAAIDLFNQALTMRTGSLNEQHPDLARSHESLAQVYIEIDDWRSAEKHLTTAIHLRSGVMAPEHPQLIQRVIDHARCLDRLGRAPDAVASLTTHINQLPAGSPEIRQLQLIVESMRINSGEQE